MRFMLVVATIALLLPSNSAHADPPPKGFEIHSFSASQLPVTTDGITTFHIIPYDCNPTDYGDGRGESDCLNGNTKSQFRYRKDQALGQTVEYRFDFWVDPGFAYEGELIRDSIPYRPRGWDSRLRLAGWEGPFIKNFVYMLKLDSTSGSTFFGRVCKAPDSFGSWVSFSMKIRWANDQKGWIKVTCDDQIVYADEAVTTTAQIQCYTQNECQPGVVRDPKSFNYTLGLALMGKGHDWEVSGFPSKWTEIQPDGLTVKMRNIEVLANPELYDPDEKEQVKALQVALNELGCDVGTPDGVVGPKTRQQAVTCRAFGKGEMPPKLTVATVGTFVELYTRDGVADLPKGNEIVVPDTITMFESKDDTRSPDEPVYFSASRVARPDRELLEIDFLLIGIYDRNAGNFSELELLLDHDIADDADEVAACGGNRIEDWGDAGKRLVLRTVRNGENFVSISFDCVLEALADPAAEKLAYLVDHFGAVASAAVDEGTLFPITNADVLAFMKRVAEGDVVVGRKEATNEEPADGLLEAEFVVHAVEVRSKSKGDSPVIGSNIVGAVEGKTFGELDLHFNGSYAAAKGIAVGLTIDVGDTLSDAGAKALAGKCPGASVFRDGNGPHLRVSVKVDGTAYTMPNGKCVADALGGAIGEKGEFLLHNFSDIAVGMAKEGNLDSVENNGFRAFLTSIATGTMTVSD